MLGSSESKGVPNHFNSFQLTVYQSLLLLWKRLFSYTVQSFDCKLTTCLHLYYLLTWSSTCLNRITLIHFRAADVIRKGISCFVFLQKRAFTPEKKMDMCKYIIIHISLNVQKFIFNNWTVNRLRPVYISHVLWVVPNHSQPRSRGRYMLIWLLVYWRSILLK